MDFQHQTRVSLLNLRTDWVLSLEKQKLALVPLAIGLGLLLYSWFASYPLSISFPGDMVFNHISPFYWLGLPLTLSSLFVLGAFSKRSSLKCLTSVFTVIAIYSLFYFYYSMPTSDSQYFRGLNEYFINTNNLDSSQLNHAYFQWPTFFLIANITVTVTGLSLGAFEFILFAVIGSLMAMAIYFYASKPFANGAFLSVTAFFFVLFYFLNFQAVPFSLALALVFVLFALESQEKSNHVTVTLLVIFVAVSLTHAFVGLFFVFYLLVKSIIKRSKQDRELFLLTAIVYLLVQLGLYWTAFNIRRTFQLPSEYGGMIQATLNNPISMPLDALAQTVSRVITVTFALLCLIGFVLLLTRRRLRAIDAAIFISAVGYLALGFVIYSMGARALPILFIPFSLGVACLFETKFKKHLRVLFLCLLILFVFIPIHFSHSTYYGEVVPFAAEETSIAKNFLLHYYDWSAPGQILLHSPVSVYFMSVMDLSIVNTTLLDEYSSNISRIEEFDCVFYTIGLGNSFLARNITLERVVYEERLNMAYDNGFSSIITSSNSPIE